MKSEETDETERRKEFRKSMSTPASAELPTPPTKKSKSKAKPKHSNKNKKPNRQLSGHNNQVPQRIYSPVSFSEKSLLEPVKDDFKADEADVKADGANVKADEADVKEISVHSTTSNENARANPLLADSATSNRQNTDFQSLTHKEPATDNKNREQDYSRKSFIYDERSQDNWQSARQSAIDVKLKDESNEEKLERFYSFPNNGQEQSNLEVSKPAVGESSGEQQMIPEPAVKIPEQSLESVGASEFTMAIQKRGNT